MADGAEFIIFFVIIAIQGIAWVLKKSKTDPASGLPAAPPPPPIPPDALDRLAARISDLEQRTDDLRRVAQGEGGRTAAVADAIEDTIAPALTHHRAEHQRLAQTVAQGVPISAFAGPVHQLLASIDRTWSRLQTLHTLIEARRDPIVGDRLADGDAVGRAFWEPFAMLASSEGLRVPTVEPISAPRGVLPESVLIGALPGHPVVFVPQDFDAEIYRWTAVPHELAHVLYRSVPGLANEMRQRLRVGQQRGILLNRRLQMHEVTQRLNSAWFEEWFCDWLTVLMCGAAGVRGLIEIFADQSEAMLTSAHLEADGHYGPHPPPTLRVMVACALLYRMGQDRESIALLKEWQARTGAHAMATIPTAHGAVRVPIRALFDTALHLANAWYETRWAALAGRTFSDIHGLEMTPGLWARVQDRIADQRNGVEFVDDPRVVVCSAMMARAESPGLARTILQSTRRAIVGVGASLGEHRASGRRRRRRASGAPTSRRRLFGEALVWTEVLRPVAGTPPS